MLFFMNISYLCGILQEIVMGTTKKLNRLKVVLAERQRTNKWLAEQLDKDPATVSKWCTNRAQPGLETLYQIASCLDVDVKALLVPNKEYIK